MDPPNSIDHPNYKEKLYYRFVGSRLKEEMRVPSWIGDDYSHLSPWRHFLYCFFYVRKLIIPSTGETNIYKNNYNIMICITKKNVQDIFFSFFWASPLIFSCVVFQLVSYNFYIKLKAICHWLRYLRANHIEEEKNLSKNLIIIF